MNRTQRTILALSRLGTDMRALTLAAGAVVCSSAFAGTINYAGPDVRPGSGPGVNGWRGSSVFYENVSESNNATESRFGAPASVTGNTIDFDPQNFEASSSGNDSAIVDSQLNFSIWARAQAFIDQIVFSEAGDTALIAFSPDQAFTSVSANFFIDVLEVDHRPLQAPLNIIAAMTYNPSSGDFQVGIDGSPAVNSAWSGALTVDIEQALIDNGISYRNGATRVNVSLDNTLTAASTGNASAFIRKKDFDGLTVTTIIPEPSSITLLAAGALSLVRRRRR